MVIVPALASRAVTTPTPVAVVVDDGSAPCAPAIPGMDFTRIAEGYGVPAVHANDLAHLRAVLAEPTTGPCLIQVDTLPTSPA